MPLDLDKMIGATAATVPARERPKPEGLDIDAMIESGEVSPASAPASKPKKGILQRIEDFEDTYLPTSLGQVLDLPKAGLEATVQTLKDIPAAISKAQTGAVTAIPKLVENTPLNVGDDEATGKKGILTQLIDAAEEYPVDVAESFGSSLENPGVSAAEPVGEIATDFLVVGRALKIIRGIPMVTKLAQSAKTSKKALVGLNLFEGQIATGILLAGRRQQPNESFTDSLKEAAMFDFAISALGLSPAAMKALRQSKAGQAAGDAIVAIGKKTGLDRTVGAFRWLGNVSDDVKALFLKYMHTSAEGRGFGIDFAEDAMKFTPAERVRIGQRLRGGISQSDVAAREVQAELNDAGQKGWAELQDKIASINGDASLSQTVRRKMISDLRQQQRSLMDFVADPQTELVKRGREMLRREGEMMLQRKNISRVFHKSLTKQELNELRAGKFGIDDVTGDEILLRPGTKQYIEQAEKKFGIDVEMWKIAKTVEPSAGQMNREKMIREMYEMAGQNPNSVIKRVEDQFQSLRRKVGNLKGKVKDARSQVHLLEQESRKIEQALDRAKIPITPEQRELLRSAEFFAHSDQALARDISRDLGRLSKEREVARLFQGLVGEQSAQGRELIKLLAKDLKRKDMEIIADLVEGRKSLSGILKASKREYEAAREQLRVARETLSRFSRFKSFPGRARAIEALQEKIRELNVSIQTSYRFGGTEYSPRMYLSKEQDDLLRRYRLKHGPGIDADLAKRRDVFLPDHVRKGMQEILDPSFPVAEKMRQLSQDRAATELLHSLARRREVSMVADEFAELAALDPKAAKRFVLMEGEGLGPLNGMYVDKAVANEIREIGKIPESTGWRIYNSLMRIWKVSKTALNPATHGRNVFSNVMFLDFAGIGILDQPGAYSEAAEQMMRRSGEYRAFRRTGLSMGTFVRADLERLTGISKANESAEWFEGLSQHFMEAPGVRNMLKLYNAEDEVARFIAWKHARNTLKMGEDEAIMFVNRHVPNYDLIPKNTLTKVYGTYQPFYKFTWAMLPIMARNVMEQPVKLAKWYAMGRTVNDLSKRMLGISDEDHEQIRDVLPSYLQHPDVFAPALLPLVPKTDPDNPNNLYWLDATYWVPYNNMVAEGSSVIPIQALDPGNPVLRSAGEILFNRQLYNNMPIYDEQLDVDLEATAEKGFTVLKPSGYMKIAQYLYNQAVPSIVGWGVPKIYKSLTEQPDYKGRVFPLDVTVADTVFGVKIRQVNPAEQKKSRINSLRFQLRETQAAIRRIRKDQSLTPEEKRARVEDAQDALRVIREDIRELGSLDVGRGGDGD